MENNDVSLRLRFYKDATEDIAVIREKFENYSKKKLDDFLIKVNENHIWIHVIGNKKQYYSPHLHIQLESEKENETHIRCLFGPDPTMWTLFMFLHFVVAGVFTIFGMFLYSNITMGQSYIMNIVVMAFMVMVWFLLYFIAKQIREKGEGQMNEIKELYKKIVE